MPKRSKKKFMESDAQVLMELVVMQEGPGTILNDLNSLIEYIQTNHVTITKDTHFFSLKYLVPININNLF